MRAISLEATEQGKEPAGLFGAEVDVWAGGQLGQPSIQWPCILQFLEVSFTVHPSFFQVWSFGPASSDGTLAGQRVPAGGLAFRFKQG